MLFTNKHLILYSTINKAVRLRNLRECDLFQVI